jgi:sugar lactone lactonase YvrE
VTRTELGGSLTVLATHAAGTISNGRQWARGPRDRDGLVDGMTVDSEGHLYVTGPGGFPVVHRHDDRGRPR